MEILSTSSSTSSAISSAGLNLAGDFNNFLTLLTTQLKHQDPLAPLDSNQFTEQLILFTNVEQTIKANANLEKLIALTTASQTANALGFLGTTIEIEGFTAALANGTAAWSYILEPGTDSVTVEIRNASGDLVFTADGPSDVGKNQVFWDGLGTGGVAHPDGLYAITVLATDSQGLPVPSTTLTSGIVTGVDTSGDQIELTVNDTTVTIDQVLSVSLSPAPPPDPDPGL